MKQTKKTCSYRSDKTNTHPENQHSYENHTNIHYSSSFIYLKT